MLASGASVVALFDDDPVRRTRRFQALGSHLAGGDPENVRFLFGVPALYLWLVFTCLVMTSCILIAARTLWRDED